jgi:hypothetical protein
MTLILIQIERTTNMPQVKRKWPMMQGEHLEQVVPLQHVTEGYTDERSEKKFLVCQR